MGDDTGQSNDDAGDDPAPAGRAEESSPRANSSTSGRTDGNAALPDGGRAAPFADLTAEELEAVFEAADYVAEEEIVTTVLLALRLGKPLLVEGEPGAGKTELAKVLAEGLGEELVRLQCYEGLAAENALYEWNYTKQLLAVQAREGGVAGDGSGTATTGDASASGTDEGATRGGRETVFSEEFLLERPLLRALRSEGGAPPVLLIDEVDRADEEFEALLLEVLSDFQVSVPELGTVRAPTPPVVVITSNRTRALSDALKRRCLYLYVEPPSYEKEREIVRRKVPELDAAVAAELCGITGRLREEPLLKQPGVAETLDLARGLAALRADEDGHVDHGELRTVLGTVLKEAEDVERVDEDLLDELVAAGVEARAGADAAGDGEPAAGTGAGNDP
jgi:MoxR-like ATPase